MFSPFPETESLLDCKQMLREIRNKSLEICHIGQISLERLSPTVMIGSMMCFDSTGKKIIVRTVSGNSRELKSSLNVDNIFYAPSIVSPEEIQGALEENDDEVHQLTYQIDSLDKNVDSEKIKILSKKRTQLTTASLIKFHALYNFNTIDKKKLSLREICDKKNIGLPPTGTGECCAPKLLDFAFKNGFRVQSMAEILYDPSLEYTDDEIEKSKHIPPCDSRCGIILPEMLGLEILYRDESIVVINKESGILSIPGKVEKDCVTSRLKNLFPDCIEQPAVHRLDMETSGILVLALTKEAHRNLSLQFQNGETHKEYEALLDGILPKLGIADEGEMELYFRVDLDNRPHQIWDEVYGKNAITRWKILDVESYKAPDGSRRFSTRVKFYPQTGRTHQLRLAAADNHGFGVPIIGDTLYGKCDEGERLLLHATKLVFKHPDSNEEMVFESKAPF